MNSIDWERDLPPAPSQRQLDLMHEARGYRPGYFSELASEPRPRFRSWEDEAADNAGVPARGPI